jgi:RNA 3'-terminal phosphate cyclase-like protein
VSPQFVNRVVDSGRRLLNRLLPDVWLHTDHSSGLGGGHSPGYGLMLVAESTTGCMLSVDAYAAEGMVPEDLGTLGSKLMLEEVRSLCLFVLERTEDIRNDTRVDVTR